MAYASVTMSNERNGPPREAGPAAPALPASERVRLRRKPDRGRYDRATIDAILDASIVGHIGWELDGQPYVTPTSIWRQGDRLYWHGSTGSRMVRETRDGLETEDWIYGVAPGKITFVTFNGDKVIKVKEEYAGLGNQVGNGPVIR